jgi:hypothetical protein
VLLSVGSERIIFSYYLLFDGDLSGFTSLADAELLHSELGTKLSAVVSKKAEHDKYAAALEHVADQLGGRHVGHREGLSDAVLQLYEPTAERRKYIEMLDFIAGMTLAERAELGRAFEGSVHERMSKGGKGFVFFAAIVSSRPDTVFVLGSFGATETFSRNDLLSAFDPLTRAAMAHYGRTRSLIIVDRDGESYEVGINDLSSPATAAEAEAERNVFGALKTFGQEVKIQPNTPEPMEREGQSAT